MKELVEIFEDAELVETVECIICGNPITKPKDQEEVEYSMPPVCEDCGSY